MKSLKSSEDHQSGCGLHLTHDQGTKQGNSFNFRKRAKQKTSEQFITISLCVKGIIKTRLGT